MRYGLYALSVMLLTGPAFLIQTTPARTQQKGTPALPPLVSLKSNESAELGSVYWAVNCKSLLKKILGLDVLEGPPEVTLSIKEGLVTPTRVPETLSDVLIKYRAGQ